MNGTTSLPRDCISWPAFPHNLFKWHEVMANYMNDSLQTNHLIAVNFPGKPDIEGGDFSYFLDAVDIMTWNTYQLSIKNIETTYDDVIKYQTIDGGYNIDKPILCSEYGTGLDTYLCDQNAGFIHRIFTGPFTGLAGLPMTWDDQNDVLDLWHYYQNINDLMSGIQLDNENWFAGEPQVQNDKSVEVFYLRKGELGENTKIVGAVSNRTYNYFTQRDTGAVCNDTIQEIEDNPIYLEPLDYELSDLNQNIKFKDMGIFKGYQIEWINALTGMAIDTTEKISDYLGHLKLEFPDTLTGSSVCPIMLFKLYRIDATFLAPIISNEFETALPNEFQLAGDLNPIEPTPWVDSLISSRAIISIFPNPTFGVVNCRVNGGYSGLKWILVNSNGQPLVENKILSPNFIIDLSVYSSGNYFILIENTTGEQVQTLKIIKQ